MKNETEQSMHESNCFHRVISACFFICVLLLCGSCGNLLQVADTDLKQTTTNDAAMAHLNVLVTNSTVRTVLPTGFDSDVSFLLTGIQNDERNFVKMWQKNEEKTAYEMMHTDDTVFVDTGLWLFTLEAIKDGTVFLAILENIIIHQGIIHSILIWLLILMY